MQVLMNLEQGLQQQPEKLCWPYRYICKSMTKTIIGLHFVIAISLSFQFILGALDTFLL